ncbi:MAG: NAD+ synthase [Gemmatimonadetes bacterium]|nr:NAD+ synthase [Gemmatimonadota bacterium]
MLRVAIGQIRPSKGDYAENLRRIGGVLAQVAAWEEPPAIIVFPETVTTGYFVEGGTADLAVTAGSLFRDLAAQHSLSGAPPLDLVLGFYEQIDHRLHNSAMYASLGGGDPGVRHVHRKVFLPTYGVFDEERFVERGHDVRAFDTTWGRAAILVCEDAWHSLMPTLAALDRAQVVFVLGAAPARGVAPADARKAAQPAPAERADVSAGRPGSVERWERLVRDIADEHGVYVVLAQLVGFEGGKGFQGASTIIGPRGDVLLRAPVFDEVVAVAELDLSEVTRARADMPLLADLETELPHLLRGLTGASAEERPRVTWGPEGPCPRSPRPAAAASHPVVRSGHGDDPLAIDPALLERWLVEFLKDEVTRRRGFATGVVGLSGGVDSAVTAFLAARAFGAGNVIGVRLPYRTSRPDSLAHAQQVADALKIRLETIDISAAVDAYVGAADPGADGARRGNVMARMRMIALFDLAAKHKALPLGTGNKTERLLGYFTWHADDAPPVNPLGDLFKTQVLALARHLGVPEAIVNKPPTADLIQGQTDEADLGIPYAAADQILCRLLRGDPVSAIVRRGFTEADVDLVRRRLDSTHWKRRLPTVAMVSQTAVGEFYLRPVDY